MPSHLISAPSTFQSLMSSIFYEYLRKFTLVFFDDILIYNTNWVDYMDHLRKTQEVLRGHKLYVRIDKCSSGQDHIAYLGHAIRKEQVAMDVTKIIVFQNSPRPSTINS